MTYPVKSPRKLIEVALPLDAINESAVEEKGNPFLKGHPRNLHQWWARRPNAAARAVLFAQLVNDPGFQHGGGFRYGMNKKDAAAERARLFKIVEDLAQWENSANEEVLARARAEIQRSWREVCELNKNHPNAGQQFNPDVMPRLHDPFAGGGAIPLEALRLGLTAHASDLNPIAVLINNALVGIPSRFADRGPVCRDRRGTLALDSVSWRGAAGLAEDVRRYSAWMREEAERRIGKLYPQIEITTAVAAQRADLKPLIGKKLTLIASLWARTVRSPSPAFSGREVPLVSTFLLSAKKGKEAYIEPIVDGDRYRFVVRIGDPPPEAAKGTKIAKATFGCLFSGAAIDAEYLRTEAAQGRVGVRLLASVCEGPGGKGRIYLPPTIEAEDAASSAVPLWKPDLRVTTPCHDIDRLPMYGMFTWGDAFTKRQQAAISTFCDLVEEARERIQTDALAAQMSGGPGLVHGGNGAAAYADAICTYLALAIGKLTDYNNSICTWNPVNQNIGHLFTKHVIPMAWDFAEMSPFAGGLAFDQIAEGMARSIEVLPTATEGAAYQMDCGALRVAQDELLPVISTDPPYYDNIGYADLSDFFYVWLRRPLRSIYPELFATVAVPKAEELVAAPHRHGSKAAAERFFLEGMTRAMQRIADGSHMAFPVTIYYARKQSEASKDGAASLGWETFLEAVLRAGFVLTGTWPVRTERSARALGQGANALASSIVLVCRKRSETAGTVSRREFQRELNAVLPEALDEMTKGSGDDRTPVAPVDLSQAILGPGMAVFSKYAAVLEADGRPMTVRAALQLINRFLTEDDFDQDTQFCLKWFEQHGWKAGKFGEADTLARSKGTSVDGVRHAGVVESSSGEVRLKKWTEYPSGWDPTTDTRNPVWETLHHLVRSLKHDGEGGAGKLLSRVIDKAEPARQLAYRLHTLCERQRWGEDARAYNEIITSWSAIEAAAGTTSTEPIQGKLFD